MGTRPVDSFAPVTLPSANAAVPTAPAASAAALTLPFAPLDVRAAAVTGGGGALVMNTAPC